MTDLHQIESQLAEMQKAREILSALWKRLIPVHCPSDEQWNLWLQRHSLDTVHKALLRTATRYQKLQGRMDADHLVRFLSMVANTIDAGGVQ